MTLVSLFLIIVTLTCEVNLLVKFSKSALRKQGDKLISFDETVTFPEDTFFSLSNLRGLKNVRVWGDAQYFVEQDCLNVRFTVEGVMIVPCALTDVDVDYPFEEDREVAYSFVKVEGGEDVIEVKKDVLDLMPVVFETIILEVPLKVVSEGAQILQSGKGWELIQDGDLVSDQEEFDPRLSKLRDLLPKQEK